MASKQAPKNQCLIKVCGIRDPGEAAALDALGIDWLGFNFHPASARYVSPEDAAPIVRALKTSVAVGVFVDADAARVAEVADRTGIRMAQLHGSENWDVIRAMPVPVIKAVPHTRLADLGGGGVRDGIAASRAGAGKTPLEYLLIDTQVKPGPGDPGFGGSGRAFDWNLLAAHPLPLPFFLAGGLGPENLAAAVAAGKPFAVDLNSKVEIAPGRKDMAKIRACLSILGRI